MNAPSGISATYAIQYNDSSHISIHLSGVGSYQGFILTYAVQGTVGSSTEFVDWQYSTDNGKTFHSKDLTEPPNFDNTTTWQQQRVDFSGITSLNGLTDVWFYADKVRDSGGKVNFDNIVISTVPEPVNLALGTFAGLAAAGSVTNWYLRARKQHGKESNQNGTDLKPSCP